ncbi:MAG TPA: monooxygenase [Actinoplanes sp.]|nr:monooxygenase [Actinoplanes sp.]
MRVTLHVWRVPRRRIAAEFLRMATGPARMRRRPGVRFAKFLGTANGFGPGNADLTRYAAVIVSDGPVRFDPPGDSVRIGLEPVHSRGSWSGRRPFTTVKPSRPDGMVLALTRARLRPAKALTFWRAVPPVVRELDAAPGLLAGFGIGEAPIGWQGTVSVWRTATHLAGFAYRQPEHRAVIARTPADRWYAEELFARFAIRGIAGDRSVLGWREGGQGER